MATRAHKCTLPSLSRSLLCGPEDHGIEVALTLGDYANEKTNERRSHTHRCRQVALLCGRNNHSFTSNYITQRCVETLTATSDLTYIYVCVCAFVCVLYVVVRACDVRRQSISTGLLCHRAACWSICPKPLVEARVYF